MPSGKATDHCSPHGWPLRARSTKCPKLSLGASLVWTLVLLQANICHSSTLVLSLVPSLHPLGIPFCFQLASSFLAKRTQLGMRPTPCVLAPLGQKSQDSRNCLHGSGARTRAAEAQDGSFEDDPPALLQGPEQTMPFHASPN